MMIHINYRFILSANAPCYNMRKETDAKSNKEGFDMDEVLLKEISRVAREIREEKNAEAITSGKIAVFAAIDEICKMSDLARKEGLLALEDEAYRFAETIGKLDIASRLIMLIVDGADEEKVRQIGYASYFADDHHGYEALEHLVYVEGMLLLQEGTNPRVISEALISLLPMELREEYCNGEHTEYINPFEPSHNKVNMQTVERLCERDNPEVKYSADEDYVYNILSYAIDELDDRAIQMWLSEITNSDLGIAMKGFSGRTRRKIFNNMSDRLAVMIAEDMEYMGPVRTSDIKDAMDTLFTKLVKLIREGMIVCPGSEVIEVFGKIFDYEVVEHKEEINGLKDELYTLTASYLGNKLVE